MSQGNNCSAFFASAFAKKVEKDLAFSGDYLDLEEFGYNQEDDHTKASQQPPPPTPTPINPGFIMP